MLKKLRQNKKGFSLVEILVAVTILGIIVGPLLISLFQNNRVIEQARKETEASYVAKKVMEETLAEYYSSISGDFAADKVDVVDGVEYPVYMGKLVALLNKSSTGNVYHSTDGYKSRYDGEFTYDIKIVPSGKIGMGGSATDADSTANYLHIYRDTVGGKECNYAVFPDGKVQKVTAFKASSESIINIKKNSMSVDGGSESNTWELSASKKDFRISVYSSNDASARSLYFTANANWWANECDRYLTNYTTKESSTMTTVTPDTDFISNEPENYYSSNREQWDIALYEITVSVYEKGATKPLSVAQGVVEVKIFS